MTEQSMVERVARAIWVAREMGFSPRLRRMEPDDIDMSTGTWATCLAQARAAIEAMREPTAGMLRYGAQHIPDTQHNTEVCALDVYQAMVDTALATPGGQP
jgi:hypothetical protein